jgi:hypothetical protein
MRYYLPFREAIPHSQVGYPRVTHPFAARLAGCPAASLDLHVLGAPPAFILSQDQTLQFELANAVVSFENDNALFVCAAYCLNQQVDSGTARSI